MFSHTLFLPNLPVFPFFSCSLPPLPVLLSQLDLLLMIPLLTSSNDSPVCHDGPRPLCHPCRCAEVCVCGAASERMLLCMCTNAHVASQLPVRLIDCFFFIGLFCLFPGMRASLYTLRFMDLQSILCTLREHLCMHVCTLLCHVPDFSQIRALRGWG